MMLVLSRRIGERIQIDGGITVMVLETDRRRIRLGIEAPASVGIQREELLQMGGERERTPVPLKSR